jgi:hypothetical protein
LWVFILYPNYIVHFFVEISFESKKNLLNFKYFKTITEFEITKKHWMKILGQPLLSITKGIIIIYVKTCSFKYDDGHFTIFN